MSVKEAKKHKLMISNIKQEVGDNLSACMLNLLQ